MENEEKFIIGFALGGVMIFIFYILLYYPIILTYIIIPNEFKQLFKYVIAIIFTLMLINSAKSAYKSLSIIFNSEKISKKLNEISSEIEVKNFFKEGIKQRLILELSFL